MGLRRLYLWLPCHCRDNGYMVPVAIELQKKLGQEGTVYTPYDVKELWQLAKEIISSLDCGELSCAFWVFLASCQVLDRSS